MNPLLTAYVVRIEGNLKVVLHNRTCSPLSPADIEAVSVMRKGLALYETSGSRDHKPEEAQP